MADKHLTENLKGNYFSSERKDMTFLKGITLVALLPIWAGYAFALYNGDSNNLSNYSLLILAFSAMNFNAICGVEKIENKVLNLVAKLDGVLFFVWVFVTIIQLLLKSMGKVLYYGYLKKKRYKKSIESRSKSWRCIIG